MSNILLNELDKELTKRKLRFVRYADDFSIYTQYKSHATATLKAIEKYLKTKLKLTINGEKSGVLRQLIWRSRLLDYTAVFSLKNGAEDTSRFYFCKR